jgi:uncharacterized membrane protein
LLFSCADISVIKQNDQSKFEEEIKKILKKALISAHENSKNEVSELIKKNEQFLDEFKNSIITNINNRCFALVSDGRLWFRVP